ncbi:alpha/beta fold hydrolase [Pseudobdellovibrio exovorus]|uniref:AB hydrolase-1 domain-containing protein n=1 Tax=Pseudobdellovibrio exovorus JSS TaxID=1184267 RepID=M4V8A5_9BACT|nr:alpha/beta hydrolase [Pseudobdellovibrio exovorus]AGH95443.1 hypothetical protein A11Q_1227 [Pseudobdellovibrio exovorus JSS]
MKVQITQTSCGPVSYRSVGSGPRKVLFFHGFPGSSSQIKIFEHFANQRGIHALCFDRPGYHKTTIKTDHMLHVCLEISKELTAQYDWQQFEVVTVSGGTPYGLSLAQHLPQKITSVRVICGLGDLAIKEVQKAFPKSSYAALKLLPFIQKDLLNSAFQLTLALQNPNKRSPIMQLFFPTSAADDKCLKETDAIGSLQLNLKEALEQKGLGPIQDARVFLSHWSQNFQDFAMPISFWHGDEDVIVPDAVSQLMSKRIKNSKLFLLPQEGHLSLPIMRAEEIMLKPD